MLISWVYGLVHSRFNGYIYWRHCYNPTMMTKPDSSCCHGRPYLATWHYFSDILGMDGSSVRAFVSSGNRSFLLRWTVFAE
ncbi:hypothetical protein MA16_Dca012506 [Dendrobium catenatum]|uniref:Uncharacterized protein n=1 Tax=Dendrobium catenatum TaxID=906689 RepID=A0A2I0W521_9ASPA|nr:hypothetical protein MA16_Dca012506 [Dendrobium catenatum]